MIEERGRNSVAQPLLSGDGQLKRFGERLTGLVYRINNEGTLSYGALRHDMREFVANQTLALTTNRYGCIPSVRKLQDHQECPD